MGCDIHSFVEQRDQNERWHNVPWNPLSNYERAPFDWRSYAVFGFLADVRNYSHVPCIVQPRGFPTQIGEQTEADYTNHWEADAHTIGWLSVEELAKFDYEQTFENRRYARTVGNFTDGAAIAEPGQGKIVTFREFLGEFYFKHLDQLIKMNALNNTRIVFWFDN